MKKKPISNESLARVLEFSITELQSDMKNFSKIQNMQFTQQREYLEELISVSVSELKRKLNILQEEKNELNLRCNRYLKIVNSIQEEKPSFGKPFFKVNLTKEELESLKR